MNNRMAANVLQQIVKLFLISGFTCFLSCLQAQDFIPSKSLIKWDQLRMVRGKRNPSELYYAKINRTFEITPHVFIDGKDTLISRAKIEALLLLVNTYYQPAGISFTICSIDYFRGNALDTVSFVWKDYNANDYLSKYYEPYTINMYFLKGIKSSSGLAAGISLLPVNDPQYKSDYVFIAEDGFSPSTIGHELGHFFGLYHPHESVINGKEFANETNCSTAGDLLCDTPAEPDESLLKLVDSYCHYTGNIEANIVDPNGDGYVPTTTNIMSYTPEKCVKGFTKDQFERMIDVYYQYKTYLR